MSQITTDCRSEEGITTGLIDGIIAIARIAAKRSHEHPAVVEALKDLRSDEDVAALFPAPAKAKHDLAIMTQRWIAAVAQSQRFALRLGLWQETSPNAERQ